MTTGDHSAQVHQWLPGPMSNDVAQSIKRLAQTEDVTHVTIMPDAHLARDVCIGAVVGTRRRLFPDAIGGDIGCGMAAVRFDMDATALASGKVAARILAAFGRVIATRRRPSGVATLPEELASRTLSSQQLERRKNSVGRLQFATLGGGNHFLELQSDDEGLLWLMIHTGSRGIGQAIRGHHLSHSVAANTGLRYLNAESPAGLAYLSDVTWALEYAEHSRRKLIDLAAECLGEVIGARQAPDTYRSCHHNFVRQEEHAGEMLWVHRKGAVSACVDEPGIIPGSMGTHSYHVTGRGHAPSLRSSSHGAGRTMSRTEARRHVGARELRRQMRGVWFDPRHLDGLRDEAPSAYKDIQVVMRAQRELTRITRRLTPLLSFKDVG